MCIWLPSNPLMKHDGGVDSVWVRFCNYFLFTAKTHRFVILRRGSKRPNINFESLCKIVTGTHHSHTKKDPKPMEMRRTATQITSSSIGPQQLKGNTQENKAQPKSTSHYINKLYQLTTPMKENSLQILVEGAIEKKKERKKEQETHKLTNHTKEFRGE